MSGRCDFRLKTGFPGFQVFASFQVQSSQALKCAVYILKYCLRICCQFPTKNWKLQWVACLGDQLSLLHAGPGCPTSEQAWAFHTRRGRGLGTLSPLLLNLLFFIIRCSNLPAANLQGLKIFSLPLSLILMLADLLLNLLSYSTLLPSLVILQRKCCLGRWKTKNLVCRWLCLILVSLSYTRANFYPFTLVSGVVGGGKFGWFFDWQWG